MREDDGLYPRRVASIEMRGKANQKPTTIDRQQEQEMEKLKNQEQKYLEQPQQPPQQPIEENNPKKIIIVVGKMGHGKSSFIKMLVKKEQKKNIQCGVQVESVTKQIKYYQLDPQVAIKMNLNFKEPIYLMDTPGLDSKSGMLIFPIIEQMTEILIQKKFQVISLIYIIKPPERIVNQKKQSLILEFHKFFPIKRSIKEKISLIILTRYDQFHKTKQQELKIFTKSLESHLKQNQLKFHKNMLNWISEPTSDLKSFKEKLGIQMSQKQKNKWKNKYQHLSAEQFLKEQYQQDYYCKLQFKKAYDHEQFIILGNNINQNLTQACTYSLFQEGLVLQNNILKRKIKEWIQAKNNTQPKISTTVWHQFKTSIKYLEYLRLPGILNITLFKKVYIGLRRLLGIPILQIWQLMRKTEKQIEQYRLKKTVMEVKSFYQSNIIDQIQRKSQPYQKKYRVLIIQSSTSQWFKSATLIKPHKKKFDPKDVLQLERDKEYEIQFQINIPSQDKLMKIIRDSSLQAFDYDQN